MTIEALVPIIVKALRETKECTYIIPDYAEYEDWLAQMVVGMVEERADYYARPDSDPNLQKALCNFGLTTEDYEWLKGRVNESQNE